MSVGRFEPQVELLIEALRGGLGGGAGASVRETLKMPGSADDQDVAKGLVQVIAACHFASAHDGASGLLDDRGPDTLQDAPAPTDEEPAAADSSFLGQLGADGTSKVRVAGVSNLATLTAIAKGGVLRQRRAALARLGELLDTKALSAEDRKAAVEFIGDSRDVEVEYELHQLRHAHVLRGRAVRASNDQWQKDVQSITEELRVFWEGRREGEPVLGLSGATRARLLLRMRDLPDEVVMHVCAVLEGADGVTGDGARRDLLTALRYAGDPRLVPTLAQLVLENSAHDVSLVREAARVLGRIDDPRVHPALARALTESLVDADRAVIAAALGRVGDRAEAPYALALLERDVDDIQVGLEALETVGGPEHSSAVVALLDHPDPLITLGAARALGRIGLGGAIAALDQAARSSKLPAFRGAAEDAIDAIRARMELRGEEAIETDPDETSDVVPRDEAPVTPFRLRVRGWRHYFIGHLWLLLRVRGRAVSRFEAAATQRPGWGPPLIAMGMTLARRGRHAQALNAFRRALQADRRRLERNPLVVRALALCFLRRAEEVEENGRHDIAKGLVGEALTLDLRWAPSALRFELQRLAEALGRKRLAS